MKTSFSLLILLCGLTTALVRDHIHVNTERNWTDAQKYCRQHYGDLSTIKSEEEQQEIVLLRRSNLSYSWIGLHRNISNPENFLWSDGDSFSFTKWETNEPNFYQQKQYCVSTQEQWGDFDCDRKFTFFCHISIILVNEMMSWEEALDYCRVHYTDLVSVTSEGQLQLMKTKSVEFQIDNVWTGLRFQAGDWFWVSGKPLVIQNLLPLCPAHPRRCGARNTKTDKWENRDCGEKLNFFCN